MKLTQEQRHLLTATIGMLTLVAGPVLDYVLSGEVINRAGVLAAIGIGLAAWAKQRKGDVTIVDAERLAEKRVAEAVRNSIPVPRGVPADDQRSFDE